MIELVNVTKTYKAKKTKDTLGLDNVSFKIPSTGLYFITGESGSGKSTLLNVLGGLDKIDSGSIKVDNIGADLNYTYRYYNSEIGRNDYLVIPFSKMESKYLSNYESVYNEFSEVLKKYDDSIIIEPLPVT